MELSLIKPFGFFIFIENLNVLIMQNNPIQKIKEVEEEGKVMIEKAKVAVQEAIFKVEEKKSKEFELVEDSAQKDIKFILEQAIQKISSIKAEGKNLLDNQLKQLKNIDDKKIIEAVDLVVKEIV